MFRLFFLSRNARRIFSTSRIIRKYANDTKRDSLNLPSYGLLLGGVLGVFLLFRSVSVIPAGHVGVVDLFGNVEAKARNPGLYFINPLSTMQKFSVKTQILTASVQVPSKEGLTINLKVSALFRVNPEEVRTLYTTVGTDYMGVVLDPQFQSVIRQVTSGYEAKDLYNAVSRTKMQHDLIDVLRAAVKDRGIIIEDAPLRGIILPETLTQAIEHKLKAEQESQRMQFVLEKEKLEAERKQIEAHGIAAFQSIVSEGISDKLLKWKGIEATKDLAESHNAKVIVIGGADGLPLILNTGSDFSNSSPIGSAPSKKNVEEIQQQKEAAENS